MTRRSRIATLAGLFLASIGISNFDNLNYDFSSPAGDTSAVDTSSPSGEIDATTIDAIAAQVVQEYSLPEHVATYVAENMSNAIAVEQEYGIPAAGVLAKAGSEHSFGKEGSRQLIDRANNHFGIKWNEQFGLGQPDKYGDCIIKETWEFNPSNKEDACFVQYHSSLDSYLHFGEFLATRDIGNGNNPYADVFNNLGSAEEFLIALAASPYSTNTREKNLTLGILRDYHLDDIVADVKAQIGEARVPAETVTPDPADAHEWQRVMETKGNYSISLWSEGFQVGDVIGLVIDPRGKEIDDVSITWEITKDNGDKRRIGQYFTSVNETVYTLLGTDFEYPEQDATLTIALEIDGKKTTEEYTVHIDALQFDKPEYIGSIPSSGRPSDGVEAGKARDRQIYGHWNVNTKSPVIALGYSHPTAGTRCDDDAFGAPRYNVPDAILEEVNGYPSYDAIPTQLQAQMKARAPHKGVDCKAKNPLDYDPNSASFTAWQENNPVFSMLDGDVEEVVRDGYNLGNVVQLNHGLGLHIYYAHLSRVDVTVGDSVGSGEQIGAIGSTGNSRGPHLHAGAKLYKMDVNPVSLRILDPMFGLE